MQIDCDGSYNFYYCCSTESADSREEGSLTSQLRKITWYDFSLTHSDSHGASMICSPLSSLLISSLHFSISLLLSPLHFTLPLPFFLFTFLFFSHFYPPLFFSLLLSSLLLSFLLLCYIFHFALPPFDTRGALTIEEAIESLRALLKAVEVQEEGSVEEEEGEEEESEKGKDESKSKSKTVVTPNASKATAAAYRSYTISEIIRITE